MPISPNQRLIAVNASGQEVAFDLRVGRASDACPGDRIFIRDGRAAIGTGSLVPLSTAVQILAPRS
jgi:hypothetical protein